MLYLVLATRLELHTWNQVIMIIKINVNHINVMG